MDAQIVPLVREVAACPDPLALYDALSDGGRREGTFLLESGSSAGGSGERSVLGISPALAIRCVGRTVEIAAHSANGRSLLPWAAERLAAIGTTDASEDLLRVTFPAPPPGERDEAARALLPSPLDALRTLVFGPTVLAQPTEVCHLAAGAFSYDLLELFEDLPHGVPERATTPHFELFIPDRLIVIDHLRHRTLVVANCYGGAAGDPNYHDAVRSVGDLAGAVLRAPATRAIVPDSAVAPRRAGAAEPPADLSDVEFAELVTRLKQRIVAGDVFQIVASRAFERPCPDPLAAYSRLRIADPSPYLFFVRGSRDTLFGASPETAVKVHGEPKHVTIRPIAGTAARGRDARGEIDPDLDARREAALRLDEKETAEHMMLVDLARNDVARVSRPGSRRVTRLLAVDRYAHVMHLVSEVTGVLADGRDALHAYAAAMNMGTVVGAPKIRAAQILREVEPSRRGLYGGAVGYLAQDGSMDTAIVIRAAVVRNGVARVRAGAGIVFDSDPRAEAQETRRKAEAVLRAIDAAGGADE